MESHFFKELEEITNTGCWQFDFVSEKLIWSPQTYRIHEVDVGIEVCASEAISFYHPEDRVIIKNALDKCIEEQVEFKVYLRIITKKGELKYVESYGKPLFLNDSCIAVFGTFKDVSKEVYLVSSKRHLASEFELLKNSIDNFFIVVETDTNGVITKANDKFCEISKYTREELIGKSHRLVNSGYHPSSFFEEMWNQIQRGEPWEGQVCNKCKDGETYWVHTFIFPGFLASGEVSHYTALRFDITEKKQLEIELQDERDKATFAAQLAAVGEISAGIAHEIANPLGIIKGYANTIKLEGMEEEKLRKIRDGLLKSTLRIEKITKGLLKLAHQSKVEEIQETSIGDILNDTLELCEQALNSHFIKLIYENVDSEATLRCNPIKISQILLNLINNAKDAILSSSIEDDEKWIRIEAIDSEDNIKILVLDSGPGISQENRDKVMERFFTTKGLGKGTGLGLALVSRFVKEHGGTIKILNDYPNTCFEIVIPKFLKEEILI